MRFCSIYLSNYIGIYNGMGLYDIQIDMTKCKNRIVIIRGDNGSGKSTLSKAMSLFPDNNDSFIPNLPARKEIILEDNGVLYRLAFIHGVKSNGERETTKAYITKTFNGQAVELNENGNVTSYKDILYNELGLDPNFAALSQLSNDDRGLADKKPSERKRFVNAIISSLDTYNSIYKILTKKSSHFKSLISAIVAKLGVLGDINTLKETLEAEENKINTWQDEKDKAITSIAREQSTIQLLDPDGSIRSAYDDATSKLKDLTSNLNISLSILNNLCNSNSLCIDDLNGGLLRVVDDKNKLIIQNQIDANTVESLIRQKEIESDNLVRKMSKLSSINNYSNYEDIKNQIEQYESNMRDIEITFLNAGFDQFSKLSKEEYILALETLKDLEESISSFKSEAYFETISTIINKYLETNSIPSRVNTMEIAEYIKDFDNEISELKRKKAIIESKLGLLDKLALRPSECKIDSCAFIRDALEFASTDPRETISNIDATIDELQCMISEYQKDLIAAENYNNAVNKFATIVREIDKNRSILLKMPNSEMFANKAIVLNNIINGYSFDYMKSIYKYIDLANLLDTYKTLKGIVDGLKEEAKQYESKIEIIDELNIDIDNINSTITEILQKLETINDIILKRKVRITQLQELEGVYEAALSERHKVNSIKSDIDACNNIITALDKKMKNIEQSANNIVSLRRRVDECNRCIAPLMANRDRLNHSLQMINDYTTEKEQLEKDYEFIEVLKHYSSPTTGIQLIFMELYMGKIISLANELLSLLFNGQFVIQPFVINESEFRIPCLGGGYLNDDISSMSSSQIGMISMILSFALLHHSSTKYNIIKLDEIDGPLDYNNRVYFMEVLNKIMDIMGTEQCIMISHNSELQVDNSDVILLKHDGNNNDYLRGNIIWKYM